MSNNNCFFYELFYERLRTNTMQFRKERLPYKSLNQARAKAEAKVKAEVEAEVEDKDEKK